jgi:hypothetical protein
MPGDLAALIHDLETAERGSRELSDEVLKVCGWRVELFDFDRVRGGCVVRRPDGCAVLFENRPSPTESVDDAIAIIPKGWRDDVYMELRLDWQPMGCVSLATGHIQSAGTKQVRGDGKTLALALCAAIVRAVQQEGPA